MYTIPVKRLRIILPFLLLGAIVNVAIAWGSALMISLPALNNSKISTISSSTDSWELIRRKGLGATLFTSIRAKSAINESLQIQQTDQGISSILPYWGDLNLHSEAFLEYYFFPAFGVLIVCLLASLSLQSKKQRRQHETALVNAARLEIELLKKNIQPHFLMNTLTSVMEWIEEDPTTGVKFIEALADEFRILSEVSNRARLLLCK